MPKRWGRAPALLDSPFSMELPEELASRPPRQPGHEPSASLTLQAYTRLKDELDGLRTEGRLRIAERLKQARAHGDIRENAEYDAAKNEQGLMEARIRHIERMLRDPEIVEAPAQADTVGAGMLVTVRCIDDDEPEDETYLLADSPEERSSGARTVTTTSPLGSALVGAKVDDLVVYEAPGGSFRYQVVEFRPNSG
jgi:transcription elongation factor GreA